MATSTAVPAAVTSNGRPIANNDPLCRCRVLYIGSAVPTITKDGLQGIQQPLKERYPAQDSPDAKGIDSWLSVWSNGLLLEYVDGERKTESAFFPIATLHYCAAVRYVNMTGFAVEGGGERFIPLDTPFAQIPDSPHPPIFAAIFRRTHGVKVLECHAFVCTNEKAANALVRCCFHSYADTLYLKMDEKLPGLKAIKEKEPSRSATPSSELNLSEQENMLDTAIDWNERAIGQKTWQRRQQNGEYDASSISSSMFRKGKRKGDGGTGNPQNQELVPYVQNGGGTRTDFGGRRMAGSNSELHEIYDGSPRRGPLPPPGLFFGPMAPPPPHGAAFYPPPPPQFLRHNGHPPPPAHLLPPPHPFFPPAHARFGHYGPIPPPPPHFGRFAPFPMPPFAPPRFLFMPPPPFIGPHPGRSKSPERTGSGPIITDVYDTFPRRATYEEPIYMPSTNGAGIPPQSSYKPGSFSPELYEHYYETYRQRRGPTAGGKKNVSRSNSDASGDDSGHHYWEGYEANMFQQPPSSQQRKAHANERAFAQTLAAGGSKQNREGTPNGERKKAKENGGGGGENGGESATLTRERLNGGQQQQHGTVRELDAFNREFGARKSEPRPETPPADYDVVPDSTPTAGRGHKHNGMGKSGAMAC